LDSDHVRVYIIHSPQDVIVMGWGGQYVDDEVVVL
jgi:hypothetical protein